MSVIGANNFSPYNYPLCLEQDTGGWTAYRKLAVFQRVLTCVKYATRSTLFYPTVLFCSIPGAVPANQAWLVPVEVDFEVVWRITF